MPRKKNIEEVVKTPEEKLVEELTKDNNATVEELLETEQNETEYEIANVFIQNTNVVLTGIVIEPEGGVENTNVIHLYKPCSNVNGELELFDTYSDNEYMPISTLQTWSITAANKKLRKRYLELISE